MDSPFFLLDQIDESFHHGFLVDVGLWRSRSHDVFTVRSGRGLDLIFVITNTATLLDDLPAVDSGEDSVARLLGIAW